MEAPCLTSFASFKAIALTLQMIPCTVYLQAQNPSWAREKSHVSAIIHPPSPEPAPNLHSGSSASHRVLMLGQEQPSPAQVQWWALPGCQLQTKAEVRSYHLPWARSCITSTSQCEKALPSWGKCWGPGLAHQPSLPFGFNLRGKIKKKKKKEKEVCWSSSCLRSFAPLGAVALCWENTGMYLHPTPGLLTVQWWLEGFKLDFPSCKASHC